MVRTIQASARHEIRSSRTGREAIRHDQRRLCDHQEEGQGKPGLRLQGKGETVRPGGSARSSQRVPQTEWSPDSEATAAHAWQEMTMTTPSRPNIARQGIATPALTLSLRFTAA